MEAEVVVARQLLSCIPKTPHVHQTSSEGALGMKTLCGWTVSGVEVGV